MLRHGSKKISQCCEISCAKMLPVCILVLILNVVKVFVVDRFSPVFDNICIERTWFRPKSHLI